MPSQTGERWHTNREQSKNAGTHGGKDMRSQYILRGKEKIWPRMQQHKGEKGIKSKRIHEFSSLPSSYQKFQEYQPTSTLLTNHYTKQPSHGKTKISTLKIFWHLDTRFWNNIEGLNSLRKYWDMSSLKPEMYICHTYNVTHFWIGRTAK